MNTTVASPVLLTSNPSDFFELFFVATASCSRFNFAIFDLAIQFGVTAHIMNPKVDTGKIIGVKRFPISKEDVIDTMKL